MSVAARLTAIWWKNGGVSGQLFYPASPSRSATPTCSACSRPTADRNAIPRLKRECNHHAFFDNTANHHLFSFLETPTCLRNEYISSSGVNGMIKRRNEAGITRSAVCSNIYFCLFENSIRMLIPINRVAVDSSAQMCLSGRRIWNSKKLFQIVETFVGISDFVPLFEEKERERERC